MFDNVALNVVIGLVLVYLLYSLFITIISEMVTTWMGLRSRILRLEIEKMLNDGYFDEHGELKYRNVWHFVQRYFLKEFEDFKFSFAGKFYDQPSIKFLSSKAGETTTYFSQKKPSYFSEENFADTLIQLFKEKGSGASDIDKIAFCLKFNTHHIQPQSLKNINRLFSESGNDISLFKEKLKGWFKETNDRALGWYKRKLQLILFWLGFIVAVVFNVDTIQIARFLSKDKEARNQLANMAVTIAADSARYNDFLKTGNDSAHAKAMLDSGMAHISEDIEQANLILGLGWNFSVLRQDDSVKLVNANCNVTKFEALTRTGDSLSSYLKQKKSLSETIKMDQSLLGSLKKEITGLTAVLNNHKEDTLFKARLAKYKITLDSAKLDFFDVSTRYNERLDSLSKTTENILKLIEIINDSTGKHFSGIDTFHINDKKTELEFFGERPCTTTEKFFYVIGQIPKSGSRLIGFIITGLMLSLGAPFWFDLLRKLVALRGSGVKPEEKKEESSQDSVIPVVADNKISKPWTIHAKEIPGDLADKILAVYGPLIKAIAGVKTVFRKNDSTTNLSSIQVNVINKATEETLRQKYPSLKINEGAMGYNIVISGAPETQQAVFGPISNASNKNGSGSLGCILKDKLTGQKHILSCWHVMKGNTDYDSDDDNTIINDSGKHRFAERWAGGIDGSVDFGLAQCFSERTDTNSNLSKKMDLENFDFTQLSTRDINKQLPVKYYDCLTDSIKNGKIYAHTPVIEIHYLDKIRDVEDVLILTNDSSGTDRAISQPGNSGSVVFDGKGNALAMIIAGDFNYSYAIKLSNIFSLHKEMEILKT